MAANLGTQVNLVSLYSCHLAMLGALLEARQRFTATLRHSVEGWQQDSVQKERHIAKQRRTSAIRV